MRSTHRQLLTLLIAAFFLLLTACLPHCRASEQEERPVNFIFLIDVSGSMISPRTMVPSGSGGQITLFEALRQALKQIVEDERLICARSKVSFITFGTNVTEKTDWPLSLATPADRQSLSCRIASAEQLQADKHGDTYMAGALDQAYSKAGQMVSKTEPCTTTFIIMLTDGWDEPPKGASLHVKDVAQKIIARQKELRTTLGVNTWQVRVVGLQRLPDKKAGTTTACQLAHMLGGEFLDVTRQGGETVAQRIFLALKKTVADLQGQVELAALDKGGLADFGRIEGGQNAQAVIQLTSRSCYPEKITGIEEASAMLDRQAVEKLKASCQSLKDKGLLKVPDQLESLSFAGDLPAKALSFHSKQADFFLIPTFEQLARGGVSWQPFAISAHVSNKCPPGFYLGAIKIISTARVQDFVPYVILVPSRLTVDQELIKAKLRKPGFFFTERGCANLRFVVNASVSGQGKRQDICIEPCAAGRGLALPPALLNGGKPTMAELDESSAAGRQVDITVDIPADLKPGSYTGAFKLKVKDPTNTIAPGNVFYELEVLPSAWEQVSPVAIPILAVLLSLGAIGLVLLLAGLKNS